MRGAGSIAVILAATTIAAAAASQELASPDAAARAGKHAAAHRSKAASRRASAAARLPADVPSPSGAEVTSAKVAVPSDPLSFGMKWNGSNESAGQTRIDNLNGGAVGTGAAVGMKLHF